MSKIALGTIKFAQGQTPDTNNAMFLLTNSDVITGATLDESAITFTLIGEEVIDYSPVDWIKGKLVAMGAEVTITVEEYEYVQTGYEFTNVKDDT